MQNLRTLSLFFHSLYSNKYIKVQDIISDAEEKIKSQLQPLLDKAEASMHTCKHGFLFHFVTKLIVPFRALTELGSKPSWKFLQKSHCREMLTFSIHLSSIAPSIIQDFRVYILLLIRRGKILILIETFSLSHILKAIITHKLCSEFVFNFFDWSVTSHFPPVDVWAREVTWRSIQRLCSEKTCRYSDRNCMILSFPFSFSCFLSFLLLS